MPKAKRERIISFRIPKDVGVDLDLRVREDKIIGIRSTNQLARKVLLDFISGKLVSIGSKTDRKLGV